MNHVDSCFYWIEVAMVESHGGFAAEAFFKVIHEMKS